jgi:single-strand DNA-binding protein
MNMNNLNKMMLIGHLGADPELREFASGKKVANLSIATNSEWKDKDGVVQTRTTWHRAKAWGLMGENAAKYLQTGSRVYLEGELLNSEYTDKEGIKRRSWEINVSKLDFLGSRQSDTASEQKLSAAMAH